MKALKFVQPTKKELNNLVLRSIQNTTIAHAKEIEKNIRKQMTQEAEFDSDMEMC